MNMFDGHFLLTFTPITTECLCLVSKGAHEFRRPIDVYFHTQIGLLSRRGTPHTFHCESVDHHHLDRYHAKSSRLRHTDLPT